MNSKQRRLNRRATVVFARQMALAAQSAAMASQCIKTMALAFAIVSADFNKTFRSGPVSVKIHLPNLDATGMRAGGLEDLLRNSDDLHL